MVETGIEQYSRDLRMLSLAEGANGVQAMDLVGRKLLSDRGELFSKYIAEVRDEIADVPGEIESLGKALSRAVEDVVEASEILLGNDVRDAGYGAYDFMTALGLLALGHMWIKISKAAVAPGGEHRAERDGRLARAGFFMTRHLAEVPACLGRIRATGDGIRKLPVEAF